MVIAVAKARAQGQGVPLASGSQSVAMEIAASSSNRTDASFSIRKGTMESDLTSEEISRFSLRKSESLRKGRRLQKNKSRT